MHYIYIYIEYEYITSDKDLSKFNENLQIIPIEKFVGKSSYTMMKNSKFYTLKVIKHDPFDAM